MATTPYARLRDVATINPPLGIVPTDGEEVSFLPMSAVDATAIDAVDTETRSFKEVRKGYTPFVADDVLVAKITPCFENGKIAQAKLTRRMGFGSTEFHVLRPHEQELDPRYLVHFLRQPRIRKEGERKMTGSAGQRRVPEYFLANLKIALPPLSEQRRIADILDKADALRATRRAALKKLDELTQSIFLDMFGDPATNPKGWQLSTIGNVSEKVTDGEHLTPKRQGNGIKLLSARNVRDGAIDMSQADFIDADEYARISKRCDPRRGDILISCSGTIGRVAPVETDEPFALVRSAAMVRPKLSCVNTRFLDAYLRTPVMKARMLREANASSQANLFQGQIRGLPVFVPPLPFQERFDKRIATAVAVNAKSAEAERALDALFASLQYRAFCGEL